MTVVIFSTFIVQTEHTVYGLSTYFMTDLLTVHVHGENFNQNVENHIDIS